MGKRIFMMFVPLCILLGFICRSWWWSAYTENLDLYMRKMQQGISETELRLEKPQLFASQLSETEWFKTLLYSDHRNKNMGTQAYTLHQYNNELKIYATLDRTLDMAFVFFPDREYILSPVALFYDNKVPERIFKVHNKSTEEWENIISERHIGEIIPGVEVSRAGAKSEGLIWVTSFPFNDFNIRANLVVYLDEQLIESSFPQELLEEDVGLAMYRGTKLIWKNAAGVIPEQMEEPEEGITKQGSSYRFIQKVGMNCYYMEVPAQQIENPVLIWFFIMAFVLLFVFCAAAVWLMRRFLLRPVNRLLTTLGIGGEMKKRQGDPYQWLEAEITGLIAKEKQLRAQAAMNKPYLMNSVLTSLIYGSREQQEMEHLLKLLGISFHHRLFRILVICYEPDQQIGGLEQQIRNTRIREGAVYYAFLKNTTAILLNASTKEALDAAQDDLWKRIERKFPGLRCGEGDTTGDVWQINQSYRNAMLHEEYVYLLGTQRGFISSRDIGVRSDVAEGEQAALDQILSFIRKADSEAAQEVFREFLTATDAAEKLSVRKAKELAAVFMERLDELSQDLGSGYETEKFRLRFRDYEEDMRCLDSYIGSLGAYVEKKYSGNGRKYVQKMIRFVNGNMYDPALSLNMVAEEMGYSPAYVSKIFKENLNCNFLEYIQNGRMEKARELLRLSDMSIHEVAVKSGFNSDISFRRVFKKETGMAPGEFRMLYRK